ncbi:hypothetical protein QR685DRAFT_587865, partial [Neurospora intermedia]
ILEPIVLSWILNGVDFALEEDGNSSYRTEKGNNIVRKLKERNSLKYYFNCSNFLNFSPIEKAWKVLKAYLYKRGKWNNEEVIQLVKEGWALLK